jgi:hypothetical protein
MSRRVRNSIISRPEPLPPVQGPGGLYVPQGRLQINDRGKSTQELFHTLYVRPTEQDYKNTGFTRYIVQERRTKKIIETSQSRFTQLTGNEYVGVQVPWKILGPLNTVLFNGKVFKGTTNQNLETLSIIERTVPEIRQYLNDPGQYTRTPAQVAAIEQATGNRVILRVADFVLLKYDTTTNTQGPDATTGYVLPGYVIVGYVL